MKLQAIAVISCSAALGACATPQSQSAANMQEEAASVAQQEAGENETSAAEMELAEAESETDPNRIVCRRVVRTGTRFADRSCRPWSEWQTMEQQSKDAVMQTQRRGRGQDSSN